MKIILIVLPVVLFLSTSSLLYAGPFGTRMNEPKENFTNLEKIESDKPGVESYITSVLPKRHSLFQNYILNFADSGLMSVIGISKSFDNDRAAQTARNAYDNIKKQLTEKYGNPKKLEFLRPDGIWKNEGEFAMSLVKNERQHGCEWLTDLPDDIKKIRLMIIGESPDSVKIGLLYEYKNIDKTNKLQESLEKDSL